MSTEEKNETSQESATTVVDTVQDFDDEPRKMNDETFDTEEDDSDSSSKNSDEEDGEEELEVEDAAMDILGQLVELFVERNGREPNQEEVMQWIDTFKSLQIGDADDSTDKTTNEDEDKEETPAASE
jgi:hypothetical protein